MGSLRAAVKATEAKEQAAFNERKWLQRCLRDLAGWFSTLAETGDPRAEVDGMLRRSHSLKERLKAALPGMQQNTGNEEILERIAIRLSAGRHEAAEDDVVAATVAVMSELRNRSTEEHPYSAASEASEIALYLSASLLRPLSHYSFGYTPTEALRSLVWTVTEQVKRADAGGDPSLRAAYLRAYSDTLIDIVRQRVRTTLVSLSQGNEPDIADKEAFRDIQSSFLARAEMIGELAGLVRDELSQPSPAPESECEQQAYAATAS